METEKKLKYSLIFLTLNEIDGLSQVFKNIPLDEFDEVFAVDGGSTDGTLEFYKNHGVRVVPQESKGRGEAFRIAIKEAEGDILIFFSPDGNEDTGDLSKFRKYFEAGSDMVIASRMMKGSYNEEDDEILRWRKWANNAFNFLANLFFRSEGSYITDSINGFRGIKKEAWNKIQPDGSGYTIEYQMTIRAMKEKLKITEFPTHEYPRAGGESYAKSIPTGIAFLKMLKYELFRDNYIGKIQAFFALLALIIVGLAISTIFNPAQTTSHPEYHRWIYQATKNGNTLKITDLLRGFDPISFDGWARPRFTTYLVTVLNVKLRLLLYHFLIPFTTLSIQLIVTLLLAPIIFYKFAKNLLRSKYLAFWATCLYLTSVGFLSNFAFLFQPGKALAHVATLILLYLLSKLQKEGDIFSFSGNNYKKITAVLTLNFIGISIDEGYLIMAGLGVFIFWDLFWPKKIALPEIKESVCRFALYFAPFLVFLVFVAFLAPEITAYIKAGKIDYIDWIAQKGKEMSAAPFLPLFYKISLTSMVSAFTPMFLMGDKIPIMLSPVWGYVNEQLFWIFSFAIFAFSISTLFGYFFSRNKEPEYDSERNYYGRLTGMFILIALLFLFGQTFLMRYHPVISGAYYYSSLFSIITPILAVLLFGISRHHWKSILGSAILVVVMGVQLINFYDLNSRWMLFHQNWIYLESSQKFSYLLKSADLINNENWLGRSGLLFDYKNKNGTDALDNHREHGKRIEDTWMRWKKGEAMDVNSTMEGFTDRDALFLHEMDVLISNKK